MSYNYKCEPTDVLAEARERLEAFRCEEGMKAFDENSYGFEPNDIGSLLIVLSDLFTGQKKPWPTSNDYHQNFVIPTANKIKSPRDREAYAAGLWKAHDHLKEQKS